jgi:hypothetical protein
LGLVSVDFPYQPGMEMGISSAHGLLMQSLAFSLFSVARRRTPIYPTPISKSMYFTGQKRMATLENSKSFSNYFKIFASSLVAMKLFSLAKEISSMTAATPDSGLESQSVSIDFMSQASNYTGAKESDHYSLPPQQ